MNEYIGMGVINIGEVSSNDGILTIDNDLNLTLEIPCKPQDCLITVKYANQETVFKVKIDQYEIAMFGVHYEDRYVAIDTVGKKMLRIESVEAFEHDADNLKGFELVDSPLYGVNYFSITYSVHYGFNIKRLKLITNEAVIDKYF